MTDLHRTKITAAIPTYNRYDLLEKCITSLTSQDLPVDQYKIIVVDNSPDNETAREFKKRYDGRDNIHYVIEKTPGASNARNIAARVCNSEYIAYIDDDAMADPAWLRSILFAFDRYGPKAAVVGGKVNPLWPIDPPHWLPASFLPAFTMVDWGEPTRVTQPEEWLAGTNFSVRVATLLELNGFAVSLGPAGPASVLMRNEETNLSDRLRAAGYDIIWAPNVKVDHLVHVERISQAWLRRRCVWQAVSDFISDPDKAAGNLEQRRQSILYYLRLLPSDSSTPRAFLEPIDDPALFEQQLYAAQCLTTLLLAGDGILPIDEPNAPVSRFESRAQAARSLPRKVLDAMITALRGPRDPQGGS